MLGFLLLLARKRSVTLMLAVWMAAGLIAGAILLVEPPTSYHYIVMVPIAVIFAAYGLDWLASARRFACWCQWRCSSLWRSTRTYTLMCIRPKARGTDWKMHNVGFYMRSQRDCCAYWYLGMPDVTPRKITALIVNPAVVRYVRDHDELERQIASYLEDEQNQVIIVPNDKVADSLPRLHRRFPGGREYNCSDRGRRMFCTYTLLGRRARQGLLRGVQTQSD